MADPTDTSPPKAATVRASLATSFDAAVALIASGSYPDGIPADLNDISKQLAYRSKLLRAAAPTT